MPFCKIPGLTGKVYLPERSPDPMQKHACQDCYTCQQCGDDRCRVCCRLPAKSVDSRFRTGCAVEER